MTVAPDARLRVAQFVNTLAVADGGPARHSLDVNSALNAREDTTVHLTWMTGALADSYLSVDAPTGISAERQRSGPRDVWRQLGCADVAIIHGFYLAWVPLVALACRLRRVPFVMMPHGVFTSYQRAQARPKKAVFDAVAGRALRRTAARFVVATEGERHDLVEAFPSLATSVSGAGTGEAPVPAVGGPHDPLRLVSLSRIAPKKRIDVAIRALADLRARGIEAALTIAGTGSAALLAELRGLVDSLELDDHVTFAGEVSGAAKSRLLASSDVFVAPSEDENFGIAVAEALAHGLPIATTRFVSAALPADGVAGRVVADVSASQLADAVATLREDDDFEALRERAISVAAQYYSWPTVAERWHAALLDAVHRG